MLEPEVISLNPLNILLFVYGIKTNEFFGSKLWYALSPFIHSASFATGLLSKLKAHVIDSY